MTLIASIYCSRDSTCNSKDDIIRITKNNAVFIVKHTIPQNATANDKVFTTNMNLDSTGLYNYMNTLIELLYADKIPFKSIQFDFLCMPAIVVTPQSVKAVKKSILRYLTTLTNAIVNTETKPSSNATSEPSTCNHKNDTLGMTYYS